MDAITPVAATVGSVGPDVFPSEYSVLLWAPLLLICAALLAWLWVLVVLQKPRRQRRASSVASVSQLEATKTIQNAAMPEGIA